MAEVTVSVGGRRYAVVCDDGQEARVRDLARRIDAEATAFAGAGPAVAEPRLLLMSALMVADKLDEAETQLRERPAAPPAPAPEAKPEPKPATRERDLFSGLDEAELTRRIEDATRRVEALAASSDDDADGDGDGDGDGEDDDDGEDGGEEEPDPSGMTRAERIELRRARRAARAEETEGDADGAGPEGS